MTQPERPEQYFSTVTEVDDLQASEGLQGVNEERPGLGGSDVAAVAGVSPFATRLDVFRRIVLGQQEPMNPLMEAGVRFEPFVLAAYAREEGVELSNPGRVIKDEWRRATVDALSERDGWGFVVEGKTTGYGGVWGEPGTDEVPPVCAAQGTWYLDIHERGECHFPVMVFPRDLRGLLGLTCEAIVARLGIRVMRMPFNPSLATFLRDEAEAFWTDHILTRMPPTPRDLPDIKRFVREASGVTAEMDEVIERFARELREVRLAIKELAERGERAEFYLREAARQRGDVETFMEDGWPVLTIKPTRAKTQPVRFTNKWRD